MLCTASHNCVAQAPIFRDAIVEFSHARLWTFEELEPEWKMKGQLQADFNEALNNLLEGNAGPAQTLFTSVLKSDSSIWEAYYFRAAASKIEGNLRSCYRDLQSAQKWKPDHYQINVELAKILFLRGDFEESERAINKAIRLNKSNAIAYYVKGDINFAQDQHRIAVNNYRECLTVDSLFHDARLKLSFFELMQRKDALKSALVHLDRVLSYDSLQKNALLFRAILGQDANKQQAIKDLTTLISISPRHLLAHYCRGLISAELGNYDRAFSDFHKVIQETQTSVNNFRGQQSAQDKRIDVQNAGTYTITRVFGLPEADGKKIKEAYCHIAMGAFDKCFAALDGTSNPFQEPLSVYLRAVAYEHKGEHVKALRHYHLALVLDKDIADAYKKRAIYEQEMKQFDRSISDLTNALRLQPEAFVIHKIRGVSYFHLGDYEQAIGDFTAYLKNDSTNREVTGFRGESYLRANQKMKAYIDFAVARNIGGIDFKLLEKLIDSVLVKGDTLDAIQSLEKVTDATPFFTEGYAKRFKIYLLKNDWESVEQNILKAIRNSRADAHPANHSYLLTLQAIIYAREKREDDAIQIFNEAIKTDRKNHLVYLERGKLFRQLGKTSKAQNDFKAASVLGNPEAAKMIAN